MIEINKQSWHYQLLDAYLGERKIPTNLCPYFWRVIQFGPARIMWITLVWFFALLLLVIGPVIEISQFGLDINKWFNPFAPLGLFVDVLILFVLLVWFAFDVYQIQYTKFGEAFRWFSEAMFSVLFHRISLGIYMVVLVLLLVVNPLLNLLLHGFNTGLWDILAQVALYIWMLIGLVAGFVGCVVLAAYLVVRFGEAAGPPVGRTGSKLAQTVADTYQLVHEKLKNKGLCPGLNFVE